MSEEYKSQITGKALDGINQLISSLMPRMPNMRYWQKKGDHYAYCWTTEPCLVKGKKRFYACVYRVLKDGTWKLKRRVDFARRKIAKKRAHSWFEKRSSLLESEKHG